MKHECLIDNIPQRAFYYQACWANGKVGSISDIKSDNVYRFYEAVETEHGLVRKSEEDDDKADPIVAVGIVAYWLHYRVNPNRSMIFVNVTNKSITQMFEDYTARKLKQYDKQREQDPSSWRSDIRRDFYAHYIMREEKKLNKQSEALFEYITPKDRELVKEVMKEYIHFLQKECEQYIPKHKQQVNKGNNDRHVNTEKLGKHFKRTFDKQTFLPIMKTLLEAPQSDKDLARVALLIHKSKYFIVDEYKYFSDWYKLFCSYVGCQYHKDYAPSALKPFTKEMENKYYFLL